ncbi:hypothetical protein CCHR01_05987 [Colletotrichum chrysophilum]|uniref:Uncharacterized protein n=1 Tax=Colletotrichum chrysophilum TaxID=1836956 RepID=A0AAD9ARK2_9PEZI|nr:hypothetical protein CCHR01_05987 [Colletotrichum chrysophilum]
MDATSDVHRLLDDDAAELHYNHRRTPRSAPADQTVTDGLSAATCRLPAACPASSSHRIGGGSCGDPNTPSQAKPEAATQNSTITPEVPNRPCTSHSRTPAARCTTLINEY